MKSFARLAATTCLAIACLTPSLHAADPVADPAAGFVDFGKFTPPTGGGQFVEVNIKSSLIGLAARLAESAEPDVADLLRKLHAIRVNVIGVDDANRAELGERLARIRTELDAKGWERIVTVQEKNQEVGVYLRQRGEEAIEGVVVTVLEPNKEAVLVNVVGDIRPEKIAELGERFGIDPLKKLGAATRKKS
ncbi:MAG: DUF4252 domain-containing protein [Limisphaerales bacterium]